MARLAAWPLLTVASRIGGGVSAWHCRLFPVALAGQQPRLPPKIRHLAAANPFLDAHAGPTGEAPIASPAAAANWALAARHHSKVSPPTDEVRPQRSPATAHWTPIRPRDRAQRPRHNAENRARAFLAARCLGIAGSGGQK